MPELFRFERKDKYKKIDFNKKYGVINLKWLKIP